MTQTAVRTEKAGKPGFFAGLKKFGGSIMPTLSKLSKAFLLPIALLPIAGVFLGVGAAIAANTDAQSFAWYLGTVMNKMGDVAFGNLPILFAMSVAMAYTKDAGVAALTALVGFLVMNAMQAALLHPMYAADGTTILTDEAGNQLSALLWHKNIASGLLTNNLGVNSLNTGVFAGIFVGAIAAGIYNKFHATQLPSAFSFFSGTKLVPIITFFAVIPLSFAFMILWPWIGQGLTWFGTTSGKIPVKGVDSLVFEMIERSLVPFGLHHVFYAPLWWTSAGGSIQGTLNDALTTFQNGGTVNGLTDVEFMDKVKDFAGSAWALGDITAVQYLTEMMKTGFLGTTANEIKVWGEFLGAQGDQNMMNRLIAVIDNSKGINFSTFEYLGLNLGRFQSGKFGFMLFGLPMGALAMWLNVPKENRKSVMGIYFSAAFTSFLTGITEPIEYTFLFLAPWLFYGVHMPLAALSFGAAGFLNTHVAMTVSGGFIDYVVFGLVPFFGQNAMSAKSVFGIIGVAGVMGGLYFVVFYCAVKFGNIMVPGRESGEAQLFTKDDYKASKGQNRDGSPLEAPKSGANPYTKSTNAAEIARYEKAAKIIEFLGGEANVVDVDSCASRLRLTVVDGTNVDLEGIKSLGGSTGALVRGTNVQVVYGGEQEAIKPRMKDILEVQRSAEFKAANAVVENAPVAVATASNGTITCPKCGETFSTELVNEHAEAKVVATVTAKPVAAKKTTVAVKSETKPATAKKVEATKAAVKTEVEKTPVKAEAKKVEAKKEAAKPATKKNYN
ncbi:PTS transporter subunit EIIC [[Acholeplasma] multilocale]|uniref:PTS transporter subunit EIIC n=1 Tax=[Acholeplasma] multilocale TaxID=264638 RepID=UPI00244E4E9C|nr:PTS transporter subunit EIIC [[Acholeplasma] multilocale]